MPPGTLRSPHSMLNGDPDFPLVLNRVLQSWCRSKNNTLGLNNYTFLRLQYNLQAKFGS